MYEEFFIKMEIWKKDKNLELNVKTIYCIKSFSSDSLLKSRRPTGSHALKINATESVIH